jgi:flagellar motor protein MotB
MDRKPKYLQAEHGARERWLVSYTDVVTILLILFIAIAAQSLKARVEPAPILVKQVVKVDPPTNLQRAEEKLRGFGLELKLEPRGLTISLPQAILFQSGDDRVSPSAQLVISQIAGVLLEVDNRVALVGHADAVPIHNQRFKNNWQLSAARSLSLLSLLTTEYGIPESRLSIQSYGTSNPKGSNETEEGRAENRRVEILILDEPVQ